MNAKLGEDQFTGAPRHLSGGEMGRPEGEKGGE